MTPVSLEKSREIKLRRQTEVFSRAFVRRERGREGNNGDQVSILSGVCPGLTHLVGQQVAETVTVGTSRGRNQTLRKGRRDDVRHVNPTTLVPGMYRVIGPSPSGFSPLSPLFILFCPLFLFLSESLPGGSTLRYPFDVPLCTRLRFSQRHSWLVRGECHRRDVVSIDFGAIGAFNFHTATLRAVSTRLSCNGETRL